MPADMHRTLTELRDLIEQRADAAARRAQVTASNQTRQRRGPEQQIDSGRDLSR
jgi:hypothetical protein